MFKRICRSTKVIALCSLSFFSCYASAQSLEEAVATAFNTHPLLKRAYHTYKQAEQVKEGALAGWYPSIDLNAGYGRGRQDTPESRAGIEGKDIRPIEYGISLRQILFDGFFTPANVDRTKAEMRSEYFNLEAQAENIALEVASAYLEVLKQQQLRDLAEKNLKSHDEIFSQIKMRTESGLGSASDLSQATGRLARANANLFSADNNLQDAIAAFFKLVGELPKELVTSVPDREALPQSEGLLLDKAVRKHPTVLAALADIQATEYLLKTSQASYYPQVSVSLGHTSVDDRVFDDALREESRADLTISYNLYRGGADKAKELENAYQIAQAKDIKVNAERDVAEGAKLSWNSMVSLERQLVFLKVHVEQSYITQQAYKKQFDLGRRTLLDLLDTENELFEARRSFVTAESDQILAQYRVMNSMGALLSSLRIPGESYWQGEPMEEYQQ